MSLVCSNGGHGFTGKMLMSTCALRISVISPCESTNPLNEAKAERYSLLKQANPNKLGDDGSFNRFRNAEQLKQAAHRPLANLGAFHSEQSSQFLELARYMSNPNSTMMSRAVGVPVVEKFSCAEREMISTVGISDFEDRSTH